MRWARQPPGVAPRGTDTSLSQGTFSKRAQWDRAQEIVGNAICTATCSTGGSEWHRENEPGFNLPAARNCKISPIFLPSRAANALKSAASGKMDNIIEARELRIERKRFYVELRENERGRFLRITEEAHGRRNSIILPSTGVESLRRLLLTFWQTAKARRLKLRHAL